MYRLTYNHKGFMRCLCALAALLLISCLSVAFAAKSAPKGVTLNISEIEIDLAQTNTFELTPSVTPAGADDNYKWWVSDSGVLKVNNGTVTCLKVGTASVSVGIHGHSGINASCLVTVVDSRLPDRIIAYPSSIKTEPGMQVQLECVVMPQGKGDGFVYFSSNQNVATIDENGLISVHSPGHATITVRSAYSRDVSTEVKLNSDYGERIRSIKLNDTSIKLEKGESTHLTCQLEPNDASRALVYASGDTSVATVDKYGVVTAVSYGSTEITVSSFRDPSVTAGIPVSVTDRDRPEKINLEISLGTVLNKGDETEIHVSMEPAGTDGGYTISSSHEEIVCVQGNKLTALRHGISTVRVQSSYNEDLYEEFVVTVEDGTVSLVMPERRTGTDKIEENLAAIDRIRLSALSELKVLYDSGEIGEKEYERRADIVNKAFEMYSFPWMVETTVKYWKAANSEQGAKDFKPGIVYYGMPYTSGENHNRTYNVSRLLEQNRYTLSADGRYYIMDAALAEKEGSYAGNDCSAFVAQAIWEHTVYGTIIKTGTLYYDNRLRAFEDPEELKAGDILVRHSSHVVMFLYWADEMHTQAVFIQQGGHEPAINTVNTVVEELSYYTEKSYRFRRLAEY